MTNEEFLNTYFEVSGEDDEYIYHDIKDEYVARYTSEEMTGVGVPKNPEELHQVYGSFGTYYIEDDDVTKIFVYKMERVHP